MRKALIAVAIAAVAVPVAVLLMYGGTGTPDEADPVMPNNVAPPQGAGQAILPEADVVPANATEPPQAADAVIHFAEDPSMLDAAVSRAAGVIQGEPAAIPDAIAAANNGFAVLTFTARSRQGTATYSSHLPACLSRSPPSTRAPVGTPRIRCSMLFGFEPDLQARYNATAHLMSSVNRDDPNATLEMANALWPAVWFSPYDSYVDAVRDVYLADVERVDFVDDGDSGGVNKINAWASENTNGRIPEVLKQSDVDSGTALVITNSIYFNGAWKTPFPEADTYEGNFWMAPSEIVRTDFMHERAPFQHASLDGIKIIKMPYEGDRLSMLVILPNGVGLDILDEAVSIEQIDRWRQSLLWGDVIVKMPKFVMETSYNLPAYLKGLGMTDAFSSSLADLSGIAPAGQGGNLYVSNAYHNAYVGVNETGTEAAAVTVIMDSVVSEAARFTANSPFIFIIQDDESGAILFMGRLSDPTA